MCFSERASWLTLLAGSAANAYVVSRVGLSSPEAILVLMWWFALLMQIPEGLEWRAVRKGRPEGRGNARLALALNLLQPVVAVIGLMFILDGSSSLDDTTVIPPLVLLLSYGVVVATQWPSMWRDARLRPDPRKQVRLHRGHPSCQESIKSWPTWS